jgi:hypothetical protein
VQLGDLREFLLGQLPALAEGPDAVTESDTPGMRISALAIGHDGTDVIGGVDDGATDYE